MPAEASTRDTDVLGGPVRARAQSADELAAASLLPRVSIGPADEVARTANASTARDEGRDRRDSEPELRSSDYLYDYVVLGLLDVNADPSAASLPRSAAQVSAPNGDNGLS